MTNDKTKVSEAPKPVVKKCSCTGTRNTKCSAHGDEVYR